MSLSNIPNEIPKPPTNTGLHRRFFIALFCMVLVLMVVVLILLHHTAPKKKAHQETAAVFDNDAALQQIKALNDRDKTAEPIIHVVAPPSRVQISSHKTVLSRQAMALASNAPLLVYHQDITTKSETPTQNVISLNNAATRVPASTHTLKAGTILPATLLTGIQSDLPGTIIAKIRQDVFDTATGTELLIPQGSTLIGQYDESIRFGQSRILLVWSKLIFPNGQSISLNRLPGVDLSGQSGLHDQVNHHYFRILGSAMLLSFFSTAQQLAGQHGANALTGSALLTAAMDQQLSETSLQWIQKNMNVAATIKIRPGANFNVLLTQDMNFKKTDHF